MTFDKVPPTHKHVTTAIQKGVDDHLVLPNKAGGSYRLSADGKKAISVAPAKKKSSPKKKSSTKKKTTKPKVS